MVRNIINLETENVSDYALRTAVRKAGSWVFMTNPQGMIDTTIVYNNFQVGNCTIDSIQYYFVNDKNHYLARTYVRGVLQGVNVSHNAEMAFDFPFSIGGKPNVVYLEMERLLLFPWLFHNNQYVDDTSGNGYSGTASGYVISVTVPWGGSYSQYCSYFDGWNNYITVGEDTDLPATPLVDTDDSFSLVCFAKIDRGQYVDDTDNGTLMWIASDPYDTSTPSGTHPGHNLRNKPAAGIWFDNSDGKMHFAVTLSDPSNTVLECSTSYTRYAVVAWYFRLFNLWHSDYPWNSFGLTYNAGTMKGYINGICVGTVVSAVNYPPMNTNKSLSIGRRDLRGSGISRSNYKYFCGVMDQNGMYNRGLTDSEMLGWHNNVLNPATIKYIKD